MRIFKRIALRIASIWKRSSAPTPSFQMGNVNRLTASWTTMGASADWQARQSLTVIRARSRQLRDDNDYIAKFVTMVKTNVIGECGIPLKTAIKDPDRVVGNKLIPGGPDVFANKEVMEKWKKWTKRKYCTVSGDLSWADVQRVVIEGVAIDGEHIVRKIRTSPEVNPFGFTLKLYEGSWLDETYNEFVGPNGNEIRMGVEIDKDGRRVAYHLLTHEPNEGWAFRRDRVERERVPAEEIIHLGIVRRANQTRYMPWTTTSGYRVNMLGKYEEAEVTAARVSASKLGFITNDGSGESEYTGPKDSDGNTITDVEPGNIEMLRRGQDIKTIDWQHPSTSYGTFMKTALRGVAAGLGVSYNTLANDMESVNFASGKLGLMDEREVWKALQRWFIESFCAEVFEAWLLQGLTGGAIALPLSKLDKFNSPIFRGRRWDHINPEKDVAANIRKINSGQTSLTRVLAEQNIEIDELLDEIQAEREALDARDIELPELISPIDIAEATAQPSVENGDPPQDPEDPTS